MGDIFLVVFNSACVLLCAGFAVKFAITRVRQETFTLWLTVMYLIKYIDREKDGTFVEFINQYNKEAKNEESN